jgi:hypothetical protein
MWPLKLSMMKRTLRPETWRLNPLSHSRKISHVIQALELFRNWHPSVFLFMFLKQRGFLYFPMTQSGSLSLPSPLQQMARVIRSLFCLWPSSYLLARELSTWKTIIISYIMFRHLQQTNMNLQYLHPIEKSNFVHIINVFPRILIQDVTYG